MEYLSVIDLVSTNDSVIDLVSTCNSDSSSDSSSYCITKYFGNGSDNGNGSVNSNGSTVNGCNIFSSDDDDTLITQPDDVALNGYNGSCRLFSQKSQSSE